MAAARLPNHDHLFKLLLIGDCGVGKSCLLLRFADNAFNENYVSTIGVDFKMRNISLAGKKIALQLWDTAGQERFRTITSSFYRRAHGVVVAYDITDRRSFDHVSLWLEEMEKYAAPGTKALIVGNKCDMSSKRVVAFEEGQELAASLGLGFVEASARIAHNVEAAFAALVDQLLSSPEVGPISENPWGYGRAQISDLSSTRRGAPACVC